MGEMKAPPSRYRIEERDRRLVVIDTFSGKDLSSQSRAIPTRTIANSRNAAQAASPWAKPSQSAAPLQVATSLQAATRQTFSTPVHQSNTGQPPDFLTQIAGTILGSKRDVSGRLVYRSSKLIDPQAPRYFVFDDRGARWVGGLGLAVLALCLIVGMVLALGDSLSFFSLVFVGGFLALRASPAIKKVLNAGLMRHGQLVDVSQIH